MSIDLAVTEKRSAVLARTEDVPADPILGLMERFASNSNLTPEHAKALMEIYVKGQRDMQEMQDERAFAEAMAQFKKNPPKIVKNRTAKLRGVAKGSGREYEFEYSYADLNSYCEQAMPMLAERGVTWSFPFSESNGQITVSCVLRYGLYEHTPTTLSAAPEGGANAIQAKGVAVAYLERYTFAGATGLTAAMPDTDGVTAKSAPDRTMPEPDLLEWIDAINNCPEGHVRETFKSAVEAADKAGDEQARLDIEIATLRVAPSAEARSQVFKQAYERWKKAGAGWAMKRLTAALEEAKKAGAR